MTEDSSNLILRLLRDIRVRLDEHDKRFDRMEQRFDKIDQRLEEMHESMYTALGLAAHSNIRHDTVRSEIEGLKERVVRLETLEGRVQKLEEKV